METVSPFCAKKSKGSGGIWNTLFTFRAGHINNGKCCVWIKTGIVSEWCTRKSRTKIYACYFLPLFGLLKVYITWNTCVVLCCVVCVNILPYRNQVTKIGEGGLQRGGYFQGGDGDGGGDGGGVGVVGYLSIGLGVEHTRCRISSHKPLHLNRIIFSTIVPCYFWDSKESCTEGKTLTELQPISKHLASHSNAHFHSLKWSQQCLIHATSECCIPLLKFHLGPCEDWDLN